MSENKTEDILDKKRTESEALSPFTFMNFSLSHLEVEGEINLKFRKCTILDAQKMRSELGKDLDEKLFMDMDVFGLVGLAYRFLSNESKLQLKKIKVLEFDNDGEEIPTDYGIKEKLEKIMIVNVESINKIHDLLLNIYGYTRDIIKKLQEIDDSQKKSQKKEVNPT